MQLPIPSTKKRSALIHETQFIWAEVPLCLQSWHKS